jgi:hypothetical protein
VWDPAHARKVQGNEHRAGSLPFEGNVYVQVTAMREVRGGPLHSDPSDVYAARSALEPARVVLVDGNDRWQAEPVFENPMGLGHDFAVAHWLRAG